MALSFLYAGLRAHAPAVPVPPHRPGRPGDRGRRTSSSYFVVVLRHEISILRRQVDRPTLRPADRAVLAGLSRLMSEVRRGRFLVQPGTMLGWHRDLVGRRWTYRQIGRLGRPALTAGTVQLVLRLARENPIWGYRNPGRAGQSGRGSCPVFGVGDPAPPRRRAIAGTPWSDLVGDPACPGDDDAGR